MDTPSCVTLAEARGHLLKRYLPDLYAIERTWDGVCLCTIEGLKAQQVAALAFQMFIRG